MAGVFFNTFNITVSDIERFFLSLDCDDGLAVETTIDHEFTYNMLDYLKYIKEKEFWWKYAKIGRLIEASDYLIEELPLTLTSILYYKENGDAKSHRF